MSLFLWDNRRYGSRGLATISMGKQALCLSSQEPLPSQKHTHHLASWLSSHCSSQWLVRCYSLTCLHSISALLDFESVTIFLAFLWVFQISFNLSFSHPARRFSSPILTVSVELLFEHNGDSFSLHSSVSQCSTF